MQEPFQYREKGVNRPSPPTLYRDGGVACARLVRARSQTGDVAGAATGEIGESDYA